MKRSRFTDSQIMEVLKQAEAGTPVPDLCRERGVSTATFYKWLAKFGGMDGSLMAKMTDLEDGDPAFKKDVRRCADAVLGRRKGTRKELLAHFSGARWPYNR